MITPLELFLLGFLAALYLVAGIVFFKFWKRTGDPLFLAFAASFGIRCINDANRASMAHPNEASLWTFVVGVMSTGLILVAIVWKNMEGKR